MKTLACKNLGNVTCDFVAVGQTADEVIDKLMEHEEITHPEELLRVPESNMRVKMEASIEDT